MRIVSLLPSATELLVAAGGERLLVGRSHECDWPPSITDRPVLTGQRTHAATSTEIDAQVSASLAAGQSLYSLDVERLKALRPDLILTQDLCEVCSIDLNTVRMVAGSIDPPPRVLSLDPRTLEDVFDDLLRVGEAAGLQDSARDAMVALRGRYWEARDHVNAYLDGPEVAFLEWMDPLYVGGHWTPGLIRDAGGRHSLNPPGVKSRRVTPEELVASSPDRLIVCPCGYDLNAIRRELPALTRQWWWNDLTAVRSGHVALVDGNQMFNRPGPRLVDAFEWLVGWLNDRPDVSSPDFPVVDAIASKC